MTIPLSPSPLFHKSVLVSEVLAYLDPKPGGLYVDLTFGSGGHTKAILQHEPSCRVIAFDWDQLALDTYGPELMAAFPNRLRLVWGNFALLYKLLKKEKITAVDGILADFGTSQMQIFERPGLSIYRNTALDMRMSPSHQKLTAAELLQKASAQKLQEIFWEFGQERHAHRIALTIVEERKKRPLRTTTELAHLIARLAQGAKKSKIHPATRVFQALRIYVNKELDNISAVLPIAFNALKPQGTFVCISFHSLEDRLIKQYFRQCEQEEVAQVLTKRVITGSPQEVRQNPSARSARLRALRKNA
jgi:16S rRNA (cytosine1402-N4)-methyltransferase